MLLTILIAAIAALVGIGLCFVGYRIFLVMLPILGFFAGLWLSGTIFSMLMGEGFLATVLALVVGIVIGLVLATLSYFFYIIGVLVVGGAIGAMLISAVLSALGFDSGVLVTLLVIAAAIGAAALTFIFNLQKYAIIILTALLGADLVILSVLVILGRVTRADLQSVDNLIEPILGQSWIAVLVWLGLAVAGVVLQLRANRDFTFTREQYVEGWG